MGKVEDGFFKNYLILYVCNTIKKKKKKKNIKKKEKKNIEFFFIFHNISEIHWCIANFL